MKKLTSLVLALAMLLTLTACGGGSTSTPSQSSSTPAASGSSGSAAPAASADDGKVYEATFATHLDENHPITKAMYQFKDEVEAKSNGRIKITTYINSELGDPTEVVDQIRMGIIQGGIFTTGHMAYQNDKLNATMWPYMFVSYEHAASAYAGPVGDYMKEMAMDGGYQVLDWMYYGFRNLSSNKPVNSVSDIAGMKLRVPSERVNQLTMSAFGATCETIAFSELYLALSQGRVDGQENPIATMDSAKVYEVNKYVAMIEYTFFTSGMIVNPKWFSELPADLQEIVKTASANAAAYEMGVFVDEEEALVQKFKDNGVTFTYPDKAELMAAAQPALDELKKDYDAAFVEEWLKLINDSMPS